MHYTFEFMFVKYKDYFIHSHGRAKFDTIEHKIYNSSKIAELNRATFKQRTAPNHIDFGKTIQSIGYFIISSSDTSAMAELIAEKYWNDTVNKEYNLCSEHSLYFMAEGTLKKWNKFYNL